jgi:predicted glycosyltransferase
LAFASLYIGDSQSMAVEACMLGTPCLRFNDFVGRKKISVLEELEHVYKLTNGISSHDAEQLFSKIEEILAIPDARAVYQVRKDNMLAEKIDVTKFWTWFIENYPASAVQQDINDEFWNQFR